ncbi:hypothetical protein ACF0H5_006111 [Mactra antiquata]
MSLIQDEECYNRTSVCRWNAPFRLSKYKWSDTEMANAVTAVNNGMSVRQAKEEYEVPKSTLSDRLSGRLKPGSGWGKRLKLTAADETGLLQAATASADKGSTAASVNQNLPISMPLGEATDDSYGLPLLDFLVTTNDKPVDLPFKISNDGMVDASFVEADMSEITDKKAFIIFFQLFIGSTRDHVSMMSIKLVENHR